MPPQISEDERSVSSTPPPPIKSEKGKGKEVIKKEVIKKEEFKAESEDEQEEGDDDEEPGEDEYVVEAITNHLVDDETGELRFEVKWEGFEKKSERTWEPEENLATADRILNEYLSKHGGRDAIISAYQTAKKGLKKRGRANTNSESGAKRGRKSNGTAVVPNATNVEFKPPSGTWEEEVVMIDAAEGTEGNVVVFLTWKGGQKTQHPLPQVYKRCPQKMLQFYESHLVFKKSDDNEGDRSNS